MWEARARPGRLEQLRDWAINALGSRKGEVYLSHQSGGDLVVLILRLPDASPSGADALDDTPVDGTPVDGTPVSGAGPSDAVPLPVPPDGLVSGSPHAWAFRQVHPLHRP